MAGRVGGRAPARSACTRPTCRAAVDRRADALYGMPPRPLAGDDASWSPSGSTSTAGRAPPASSTATCWTSAGSRCTVVHAPGHTGGHSVFVDRARRRLASSWSPATSTCRTLRPVLRRRGIAASTSSRPRCTCCRRSSPTTTSRSTTRASSTGTRRSSTPVDAFAAVIGRREQSLLGLLARAAHVRRARRRRHRLPAGHAAAVVRRVGRAAHRSSGTSIDCVADGRVGRPTAADGIGAT